MAKKFEIIGLSLLLVAFGWECFSQTLSDNKVESLLTELHHKIDMLWECEYAEFTQSPQNTTTSIALVDMNMTNRQWKSYEQIRADFELSDEQEEFGQMARIILYISGSICGYWQKYSRKAVYGGIAIDSIFRTDLCKRVNI